ncbi:MAG: ABC transporter permease, partial [Gemmataceae bacterium]
ARGLAYRIANEQSVTSIPASYQWLGLGSTWGIPNPVILMVVLYALAHMVMTRMTLGRYVYATGGNLEAARLSGVPVQRVRLFAYALGGLLAGLGGIIMASQFKSALPTYGINYELAVIAAVVVGGTSLQGGEGNMLGTLLGAFIIGVIQNGMNLLGLRAPDQLIVMGLVILGAVLLDRFKHVGLERLQARWQQGPPPA